MEGNDSHNYPSETQWCTGSTGSSQATDKLYSFRGGYLMDITQLYISVSAYTHSGVLGQQFIRGQLNDKVFRGESDGHIHVYIARS